VLQLHDARRLQHPTKKAISGQNGRGGVYTMELHVFKVGSRYWIFKKSSKLGEVLTEPAFWMMVFGGLSGLVVLILT